MHGGFKNIYWSILVGQPAGWQCVKLSHVTDCRCRNYTRAYPHLTFIVIVPWRRLTSVRLITYMMGYLQIIHDKYKLAKINGYRAWNQYNICFSKTGVSSRKIIIHSLHIQAFFTNSDFKPIAPIPSILQSIS